jgi:hypothetical protein
VGPGQAAARADDLGAIPVAAPVLQIDDLVVDGVEIVHSAEIDERDSGFLFGRPGRLLGCGKGGCCEREAGRERENHPGHDLPMAHSA